MHTREVIDALKVLDHEDDDHWTVDGAPRLDAVQLPGLTREMITHVAPQFARGNPDLPDLDADRAAAEKAMLVAAEAQVMADEAKKKALQLATKIVTNDRQIQDSHSLTRANQAWIKSQMEADAARHARAKHIDSLIRDAGGPKQIGRHPVEINEAARNKAKRRNITLPPPAKP